MTRVNLSKLAGTRWENSLRTIATAAHQTRLTYFEKAYLSLSNHILLCGNITEILSPHGNHSTSSPESPVAKKTTGIFFWGGRNLKYFKIPIGEVRDIHYRLHTLRRLRKFIELPHHPLYFKYMSAESSPPYWEQSSFLARY